MTPCVYCADTDMDTPATRYFLDSLGNIFGLCADDSAMMFLDYAVTTVEVANPDCRCACHVSESGERLTLHEDIPMECCSTVLTF